MITTVELERPIVLTDITCEDSCRLPGIYGIRNIQNGKIYIGSSTNPMIKRWQGHDSCLRNGKHSNRHLGAAFAKHGRDAFEYLVLEVVDDLDRITEREQYWIDYFRKTCPGIYNMMPADRHRRGYRLSDSCRKAISDTKKSQKRRVSLETKQKLAEAFSLEYPEFIHEETGEIIPAGVGLAKMCRERGLRATSMSNVRHGRYRSSDGWTLVDQGPWNKHREEFVKRDRQKAIDKFWSRVNVGGEGECWEWTEKAPTTSIKEIKGSPARVSWILANGAVPDGKCVLRECLNLACVNPRHLYIGSISDLREDVKKRRGGKEHPNAKITWDDVHAIRDSEEEDAVLAERFGVSCCTIYDVRIWKSWKNDPLRGGANG